MNKANILAVVSLCFIFGIGLIEAGDAEFFDNANPKYNLGPVEIIKENDNKKIFKIGSEYSRK